MLFSPEEYLDRQSRLRRELEAARLDALLVSGDDNIIYFSGDPFPAAPSDPDPSSIRADFPSAASRPY